MRAILLTAGLTMDSITSDTQRVRFLLGSPPEITHSALTELPTAYSDVLRASAAFLREVYDARWIRGHKHNQRKEGNTDGDAGGGHAAGS